MQILKSDFEAKIRSVNSVSGEKLHDFEIICPARGVHLHPPIPTAYRPAINRKECGKISTFGNTMVKKKKSSAPS